MLIRCRRCRDGFAPSDAAIFQRLLPLLDEIFTDAPLDWHFRCRHAVMFAADATRHDADTLPQRLRAATLDAAYFTLFYARLCVHAAACR